MSDAKMPARITRSKADGLGLMPYEEWTTINRGDRAEWARAMLDELGNSWRSLDFHQQETMRVVMQLR